MPRGKDQGGGSRGRGSRRGASGGQSFKDAWAAGNYNRRGEDDGSSDDGSEEHDNAVTVRPPKRGLCHVAGH
jgi:hypothetical protein